MRPSPIEINLDGQKIVVDVAKDTSRGNLDSDMDAIASLIAWYNELLAAAMVAADVKDAEYRRWRATIASARLSRDLKLPEYKLKIAIEADVGFLQHKTAVANADGLVVRLRGAIEALRVKAQLLPTRGAIARDELASTGIATKDRRTVDADEEEGDTGERGRGPSSTVDPTKPRRHLRRRRPAEDSSEEQE